MQLKPEILVCKNGCINDQCASREAKAKSEKKRQERALKLVYVDKSYLYTVFSVSEQKCEGGKGVGDYNVVGPPL